jgi:hypothetical protein
MHAFLRHVLDTEHACINQLEAEQCEILVLGLAFDRQETS